MEKENKFCQSLVKYGWGKIAKLPINPWYVGVIVILLSMVISWSYGSQSMAGAKSVREAIEKAAKLGDYELAQDLYKQCQAAQCHDSKVLGVDSELEELVYPERNVEREIAKYEELNTKYPGSRDILVALSDLYRQLGNEEKAKGRWEEAKILDPNNEIFRER